MKIAEFNTLGAEEAAEIVRPCAGIDSFVRSVVAGRPYSDVAALLRAAETQAATWNTAEVDAALADHPRIGERHQGTELSATMSHSEQAGLDFSDAEFRQRLADGNRRYEERFGRTYLVRAKGRSTDELLRLLEQRLGNDDATEAEVVHQQLTEITLLRLATLFETPQRSGKEETT